MFAIFFRCRDCTTRLETMSPVWLVGLLAVSLLNPTFADVKHVLEGSAHPPQCHCSQTQYHQNHQQHAFASSINTNNYPIGEPNSVINEAVPSSAPYWWINNPDSPFKKAYEQFKKCSADGNCVSSAPVNAFQINEKKQTPVPVQVQGQVQGSGEVLRNNPFLTGKVGVAENNLFSKDQTAFSANGQSIDTSNGFLGVQPNTPSFNGAVPNNEPKYENCNNVEYVCVERHLCLNGVVQVFGEGLFELRTKNNFCESGKEVCCRLPNLSTPAHQLNAVDSYTASKTSKTQFNTNFGVANLSEYVHNQNLPGSLIKFGGNSGLSPGSIQVIPAEEENGALVPAGSSNSNRFAFGSTISPNSLFQGTIDYSNVKFDQTNFGSNFAGEQYLPPVAPTIRTYAPSIPTTPRPINTISYSFSPSSPKPFTVPPRTPTEYLPPRTSTSKPFTYDIPKISTFPPVTQKSTIFTFPTQSSTPRYSYQTQPSTTRYTYPSQPSTTRYTPRYTFSSTPRPIISYTTAPSQTFSKITGYSYQTPTPTFGYPKYTPKQPTGPNYTGESSFTIENQYKFSTSGYSYPTPTPSFPYPSPSSPQKVTTGYIPPITSSTSGYSYPSPSPIFTLPPVKTPPPTRRPPVTSNTYLPPLIDLGSNKVPVFVGTTKQPEVPRELAGCAAALKCVPIDYCTAQGVISQTPVVLTKQQQSFRVPTTQCLNKETGVAGYCCRDPNYVDPWPSANLLNGEDDGQYREDPSLGQYFPERQRVIRSENENRFSNNQETPRVTNTDDSTCGIRHLNTEPKGRGPIDVNFAEIPWQAMVLRDGNRSLLCGGVIVKRNAVLTAAHCVEGLETSDILIKGGEWKLGIDEEPLPFQIVKVGAIIRHPQYKLGSLNNDLALLMLEEKLNLAKNIAPICLQPPNQPIPQQCIVTGWGKRILQAHLRNSVMRSINVHALDSKLCSDVISKSYKHVMPNLAPNTRCMYSSNDQCDVDYGSALACTNGNNQYSLAAVFSWDTGCKDKSQIGGYIVPDVEWIESITGQPLTHLKDLDRKYRSQHRSA